MLRVIKFHYFSILKTTRRTPLNCSSILYPKRMPWRFASRRSRLRLQRGMRLAGSASVTVHISGFGGFGASEYQRLNCTTPCRRRKHFPRCSPVICSRLGSQMQGLVQGFCRGLESALSRSYSTLCSEKCVAVLRRGLWFLSATPFNRELVLSREIAIDEIFNRVDCSFSEWASGSISFVLVESVTTKMPAPVEENGKEKKNAEAKELFLKIGLEDKTAQNAVANPKVTANLIAVIVEVHKFTQV